MINNTWGRLSSRPHVLLSCRAQDQGFTLVFAWSVWKVCPSRPTAPMAEPRRSSAALAVMIKPPVLVTLKLNLAKPAVEFLVSV